VKLKLLSKRKSLNGFVGNANTTANEPAVKSVVVRPSANTTANEPAVKSVVGQPSANTTANDHSVFRVTLTEHAQNVNTSLYRVDTGRSTLFRVLLCVNPGCGHPARLQDQGDPHARRHQGAVPGRGVGV